MLHPSLERGVRERDIRLRLGTPLGVDLCHRGTVVNRSDALSKLSQGVVNVDCLRTPAVAGDNNVPALAVPTSDQISALGGGEGMPNGMLPYRAGSLRVGGVPAILAEVQPLAEVVDGHADVVEGARRQVVRARPLSLGFASVAPAVVADNSPISVVAVVQQALRNLSYGGIRR